MRFILVVRLLLLVECISICAVLIDARPQSLPIAPGTAVIGTGYNVFQGRDMQSVVEPTALSYDEGNTLRVVANDSIIDFAVADQTHTRRHPSAGVRAYSYRSVKHYREMQAQSMGVEVGVAAYGAALIGSAGIQNTERSMRSNNAYYVIAQEHEEMYELCVNYNDLPLSAGFLALVDSLPSVYDSSNEQPFYDMLSQMGTHLTTCVTMGGSASLEAYATLNDTQELSETDLSMQVTASFIGKKFQSTALSGKLGLDKEYTDVRSFAAASSLSLRGGDPLIAQSNEAWFLSWIASVHASPAVVGRRLTPIASVVAHFDECKARAFLAYLERVSKDLSAQQEFSLSSLPVPLSQCECRPCDSAYQCHTADALTDVTYTSWWGEDIFLAASGHLGVNATGCRPCVKLVPRVFKKQPTESSHRKDAQDSTGRDVSSSQLKEPQLQDTALRNRQRATTLGVHFRTAGASEDVAGVIPGVDRVGSGFDARVGEFRAPLVDVTYALQHTWTTFAPSGKPVTFAVPDQYRLFSEPGQNAPNTRVFRSSYEYRKAQAAKSGITIGVPGVFSLSHESSGVDQFFSSGETIVATTEREYNLYRLSLLDQLSSSLSQGLVRAYDSLPFAHAPMAYEQFIRLFGTHVVTEGTLGASAQLLSAVSQESYARMSMNEMQNGVGLHYEHFEAGVSYGTSSGDGSVEFSKGSFGFVSFKGGRATTVLTDQWSDWLQTVIENPAQVSQRTVPIWELFPDGKKKDLLRDAVEAYISEGAQEADAPVDDKPTLSVSLDHYSDSLWAGSITSDLVQLNSGFLCSDFDWAYNPHQVSYRRYSWQANKGEKTLGSTFIYAKVSPRKTANSLVCDNGWFMSPVTKSVRHSGCTTYYVDVSGPSYCAKLASKPPPVADQRSPRSYPQCNAPGPSQREFSFFAQAAVGQSEIATFQGIWNATFTTPASLRGPVTLSLSTSTMSEVQVCLQKLNPAVGKDLSRVCDPLTFASMRNNTSTLDMDMRFSRLAFKKQGSKRLGRSNLLASSASGGSVVATVHLAPSTSYFMTMAAPQDEHVDMASIHATGDICRNGGVGPACVEEPVNPFASASDSAMMLLPAGEYKWFSVDAPASWGAVQWSVAQHDDADERGVLHLYAASGYLPTEQAHVPVLNETDDGGATSLTVTNPLGAKWYIGVRNVGIEDHEAVFSQMVDQCDDRHFEIECKYDSYDDVIQLSAGFNLRDGLPRMYESAELGDSPGEMQYFVVINTHCCGLPYNRPFDVTHVRVSVGARGSSSPLHSGVSMQDTTARIAPTIYARQGAPPSAGLHDFSSTGGEVNQLVLPIIAKGDLPVPLPRQPSIGSFNPYAWYIAVNRSESEFEYAIWASENCANSCSECLCNGMECNDSNLWILPTKSTDSFGVCECPNDAADGASALDCTAISPSSSGLWSFSSGRVLLATSIIIALAVAATRMLIGK